jgi:hypothetical protein
LNLVLDLALELQNSHQNSRTLTRTPDLPPKLQNDTMINLNHIAALHRRMGRPENQAGRQINTPISLSIVTLARTVARHNSERSQRQATTAGGSSGGCTGLLAASRQSSLPRSISSLVNMRYGSGPSIRVGGDGSVCSGVLVWWGWDRTGVRHARCFT